MKYLIAIVLTITLFSCYQPKSTYKIEVSDLDEFESIYFSMDTLLRKINGKGCPENMPCKFLYIDDFMFVGFNTYYFSSNFKNTDPLFQNFTTEEFLLLEKNICFLRENNISGAEYDSYCNISLFTYKVMLSDDYYDEEHLTYIESEEQFRCVEDRYHVLDRKGDIVLFLYKYFE